MFADEYKKLIPKCQSEKILRKILKMLMNLLWKIMISDPDEMITL